MSNVSTTSPAAAICASIGSALSAGNDREACRIFNSIDDDEVFAVVSKRFPALRNYDARGNWVGSVSNENGWTP